MDLSGLQQAVTVAAVTVGISALLGVSVLVWAGVRTARGLRRRYRALRYPVRFGHGIGRRLDISTLRAATLSTLGSPGWWAVQRDRHQMWRSVTAAQHAVAVARRAGAPIGDLRSLLRQLEAAARSVDALARASASTLPHRTAAAAEMYRVSRAAGDLHRTAVDSLRAMATADVEPVLSAVRLEVAALSAGIRAARHPAL